METKKFALILLHNLRVVSFDSKEEMEDNMSNLKQQNKLCIPLKWHVGDETYYQMEAWDY